MPPYLLAIDQGTTNSRAIIFNQAGILISSHELALKQSYPQYGWVEQDPEEMFTNTIYCVRESLRKANIDASAIAGIGISNQRETTIIWHKKTGLPIYPAIVWQDRRTSDLCKRFANHSIAAQLRKKTGLLLDPYFSATKICWILDNIKGSRALAEQQQLLFGTVDCYLLWRLTGGKTHATDITNAARTLLFNIHNMEWDSDILDAFHIPASLLPTVMDNTADFGETMPDLFGAKIKIAGIAGDQQAAAIGQTCISPGMIKATFGTGCFLLANTGKQIIQSEHKLLSTIAYRIKGELAYCLEGSIFSAGVIIKWLRDTLKLIDKATDTTELAESIPDNGGVYLVPAFTGLGAPYWQPDVRAAIFGLHRNSGKQYFARAALESVAYQTKDLLDAMAADMNMSFDKLHVDGGMIANPWLAQFLADILNIEIDRPKIIETTALGAAYLAGIQVGLYANLQEISQQRRQDVSFQSNMAQAERNRLYAGWQDAIGRLIS